jgi:Flp pilus assembly protein TadG
LLSRQSMLTPKRARPSSRGVALAEAGIILTLLIPLTFSVLDFAGILYAFLAMQNGVSQATRYAVTGNHATDSSGAALSRDDSIRKAMRAATPGFAIGDDAFTFYNLSKGTPDSGGPNDIIRVTVAYNWQLFTPFLRPFFDGGYVAIHVASTMKNEPYPNS